MYAHCFQYIFARLLALSILNLELEHIRVGNDSFHRFYLPFGCPQVSNGQMDSAETLVEQMLEQRRALICRHGPPNAEGSSLNTLHHFA